MQNKKKKKKKKSYFQIFSYCWYVIFECLPSTKMQKKKKKKKKKKAFVLKFVLC